MKANHNLIYLAMYPPDVVVNINKSKNESKSQLLFMLVLGTIGCGKYQ